MINFMIGQNDRCLCLCFSWEESSASLVKRCEICPQSVIPFAAQSLQSRNLWGSFQGVHRFGETWFAWMLSICSASQDSWRGWEMFLRYVSVHLWLGRILRWDCQVTNWMAWENERSWVEKWGDTPPLPIKFSNATVQQTLHSKLRTSQL